MKLEKQVLEHNKMQFLRYLGVDISDASMVKLFQRDHDNSVVPWNLVCSDKDGLYVDNEGRRESVSVHFYEADSNNYDHKYRLENQVYTTDDLVKKLPSEIEGPMYSYYLNIESTTDGFCVSYPSLERDILNSAYINGASLKEAAYNTLLMLAENKIEIPYNESHQLESQTLTHSQMKDLRHLGVDTSDASMVKLFFRSIDNSYIDESNVIPVENGYITHEGAHSEEAFADYYAKESNDYAHALLQKSIVYTSADLYDKLPTSIYVDGVHFNKSFEYDGYKFKMSYRHYDKSLKGMECTSGSLKDISFNMLTAIAEKGYLTEDEILFKKGNDDLLTGIIRERKAGTISLYKAAQELNESGWLPSIDEEKTEQLLTAWEELSPRQDEDITVIYSAGKVLIIGERDATMSYYNKTQRIPIICDILSMHNVKPYEIRSWNSFLKGKAIPVDNKTVMSLYKGSSGYNVKTFAIQLVLTQFVTSKDVIISNSKDGKFEELRACTMDLKVKDNVFLSLFYHIEHENKEVEDNYCTVRFPDALKAYDVGSFEGLKGKLSDGHLGNDTWLTLIKELKEKGLQPLIEESGKYNNAESSLVPGV